jgi:uncharacterized protein (UPF0335 family)
MPLEHIIALVTAIGGAGAFWQYLNAKAERENERLMADKETRAEFNTTLRAQVDMLMSKVDKLVDEKEDLMTALMEVKEDLAEARAQVKHLEDIVRLRQNPR